MNSDATLLVTGPDPRATLGWIAKTLSWRNPTTADLAVAAFLLDWKLAAHHQAPIFSRNWKRDYLGLPIAPAGSAEVGFQRLLESLDNGSPGAHLPAFRRIKLDRDSARLIELSLLVLKSIPDSAMLRRHFLAAIPVFSSPSGAEIDLLAYAAVLGLPKPNTKGYARDVGRRLLKAKLLALSGIAARPKPY